MNSDSRIYASKGLPTLISLNLESSEMNNFSN